MSNKNITDDTNYHNETVGPNYYSSSIYYGAQENYSPTTCKTTHSPHIVSSYSIPHPPVSYMLFNFPFKLHFSKYYKLTFFLANYFADQE